VPGVATVSQVRQAPALVEGSRTIVTAVDPDTITQAVRLEVDPSALTGTGIVTDTDTAAAAGLAVGDPVSVNWGGTRQTLTLDATYAPKGSFTGYVVSLDTLDAAGLPEADITAYIVLAPDADHAETMAGLDEVAERFPTVTVQDQTELKESISSQISQVLNLIYGLLALSVFIAIIGVVNTLALSVIERTREIGMLRAVGTTRKQVRSMIRWESIVISVFGAITGVLLGLGLGMAAQRLFVEDGITQLGIPVGVITTVLLGTAVVGVLAAMWPARRAARLDVLDAIRTE
jgi:putative ABC transport system permease protein